MLVSPITPVNNYKRQVFKQSKFENTSFTGKIQLMDKTYEKIGKFIGKRVLNNKVSQWVVEKLKDINLISHLSVLTALTLSGFYMQQTAKNKKLDEKKRNTLVINQGLVAVLSTIGGYFIDGKTDKLVNKYIAKFKVANAANPKLDIYLKGIKNAKSIIIFGTIYRFIAPVLVTPLANWIGNKIAEPKKAQISTKA